MPRITLVMGCYYVLQGLGEELSPPYTPPILLVSDSRGNLQLPLAGPAVERAAKESYHNGFAGGNVIEYVSIHLVHQKIAAKDAAYVPIRNKGTS